MPKGNRWDTGKLEYGSYYKTVLKDGNIKFIQSKEEGSASPPKYTNTRGRIYVLVNPNGILKSIVYFDNDNNRKKQIDLDRSHNKAQMKRTEHTHHGYEHNENDGEKGATDLTTEELRMVERVRRLWYNHNSK